MVELALALNGDSAHTPPSHIVENLSSELALREVAGAPHTIYAEIWHAAYWQQVTIDWVSGVETPCPAHNDMSFPTGEKERGESWADLCWRFLAGAEKAAAIANCTDTEKVVVCPSPPGKPARKMTVRDQLESLAAHNAYHLGRVVLLRQMLGSWPPPSGGFTW
jgi:DinB superfamily